MRRAGIAWVAALTLLLIGGSMASCSEMDQMRDLWQELPHPSDVGLNGSIQQIAASLGESLEPPGGYGWSWEHIEEDWDTDHPLSTLKHGLTLQRHGVPGEGALPRELIDLVDEAWLLPFEDFSRYAVQHNRVVLIYIGPDPQPEPFCIDVVFLVDVRRVTDGGRDQERWSIEDAIALPACPLGKMSH